MFALIKREIRDNLIYFIAAIISSTTLICISIPPIYDSRVLAQSLSETLGIFTVIFAAVVFFSMGATQMYIDKNRKISAFLAILPTNREKILLARIVTGILGILTWFVPLFIAITIFLRIFNPLVHIYSGMMFEISFAILLLIFACYCIGLQVGWTEGKIIPALGGFLLIFIFVSLIYVKGFGSHSAAILILFIAASVLRIRHKFLSTSL